MISVFATRAMPGGIAPGFDSASRTWSETSDGIALAHLARHATVPGQPFGGHSGQGFAGSWQGISPAASIDPACMDMTRAALPETGTARSIPSMATMPRAKNQRLAKRFRMRLPCHAPLTATRLRLSHRCSVVNRVRGSLSRVNQFKSSQPLLRKWLIFAAFLT